jgi:carbonic anhydrase/acetyltransferase-like protein (isoleucine patch superfamily)
MEYEASNVVLGRNVYIAPTSYVGGDVTIGDETTIMHNATVRGDVSKIRIGARVNIQDGAVIHTDQGVDLDIEDEVSIAHRAVIHCVRIRAGTLIGIGAIVLDGCDVGRGCLVAAGTVLAPNTVIPDGKLVMGAPGKVVRDVTAEDQKRIRIAIANYIRLGRLHAAGEYPNAAGPVTPS